MRQPLSKPEGQSCMIGNVATYSPRNQRTHVHERNLRRVSRISHPLSVRLDSFRDAILVAHRAEIFDYFAP